MALFTGAGGAVMWLGARSLTQGGKPARAAWLLVACALSTYTVGVLLWSGVTPLLALGGWIFTVLVAALTLTRRELLWAGFAGAAWAAFTIALDRSVPWPRYDVSESMGLRVYVYVTVGAVVAFALWELARAYRKTTTIRTRLIVTTVVLVVLVAVAVSSTSIVVSLESQREQAFQQLESVAALKQAQVSSWVEELERDLRLVAAEGYGLEQARTVLVDGASDAARRDAARALKRRFVQVIQHTHHLDELYLVDLTGMVALSSAAAQVGKLEKQESYYERGQQGPYVHPPTYYSSWDDTAIVVARPLHDAQGVRFGMVAGRVGMDTLSNLMAVRVGLAESGETYLVSASHDPLTQLRYEFGEGFMRTDGLDWTIVHKQPSK
jgi:uncharacterized membrane protein